MRLESFLDHVMCGGLSPGGKALDRQEYAKK